MADTGQSQTDNTTLDRVEMTDTGHSQTDNTTLDKAKMEDTYLFCEDELIQLSFLRDLETDELISEGLLGDHLQLSHPLDEELVFAYDELTLRILAGQHYPAVAVTWSVETIGHSLSRTAIIALRVRLHEIADEASHTNNLEKWRECDSDAGSGIYEPTMVVLSMVKETIAHIAEYRRKVEERTPLKQNHKDQQPQKSRHTTYDTQPQLKQVANITQINRGTSFELLGKTAADIICKIPSQFRVLHVEEVLRQDLVEAFRRRQEDLRQDLLGRSAKYLCRFVPPQVARKNRAEDMVEHIVKPHQTWHGTQRQFVPSIVRHGFLKPGARNPTTKTEHGVRCGSTYGRGIYSSPDPAFSLSYSNWNCEATTPDQYFGLKLIICATLMGRTSSVFREDNWREKSQTHSSEVDSYVANQNLEYIVFSPAQIVPVYVVHLDWGEHNAAHFANLSADPTQWTRAAPPKTHKRLLRDQQEDIWPDEARRAKQAIMARAAKWFPYGYGPATNGKFVVEEVGEVDDDEEEYGDYQALRGEGEGEDTDKDKRNMDFWSWVKAAAVEEEAEETEFAEKFRKGKKEDEYWKERSGKGGGSRAAFVPNWDEIPDPVVLGHSEDEDEDGDEEEESEEDEGYGLERLLI